MKKRSGLFLPLRASVFVDNSKKICYDYIIDPGSDLFDDKGIQ